jgi:hypothetical protein
MKTIEIKGKMYRALVNGKDTMLATDVYDDESTCSIFDVGHAYVKDENSFYAMYRLIESEKKEPVPKIKPVKAWGDPSKVGKFFRFAMTLDAPSNFRQSRRYQEYLITPIVKEGVRGHQA